MKTVRLPKAQLSAFGSVLRDFGEVHAPVERDGVHVFQKLEDWPAVCLDYMRTVLPPKKYFLPPREPMFRYTPERGYVACTEIRDGTGCPMKSTLALCLGNRLMGDDGIACHVADRLATDPTLPADIDVVMATRMSCASPIEWQEDAGCSWSMPLSRTRRPERCPYTGNSISMNRSGPAGRHTAFLQPRPSNFCAWSARWRRGPRSPCSRLRFRPYTLATHSPLRCRGRSRASRTAWRSCFRLVHRP